jgi:hypothetical protein
MRLQRDNESLWLTSKFPIFCTSASSHYKLSLAIMFSNPQQSGR